MAYFLVDTSHAGYQGLIDQCRLEHEKNSPGTRLSVALNQAKTRALVKVHGASKAWASSAAILDRSDSGDEHAKFVALLSGADWHVNKDKD